MGQEMNMTTQKVIRDHHQLKINLVTIYKKLYENFLIIFLKKGIRPSSKKPAPIPPTPPIDIVIVRRISFYLEFY